jgi:cytochrome bd-type quinol oxidase subunit 2
MNFRIPKGEKGNPLNYLSILLILILAIFLIWKRVKDKSKSSTILAILSLVLTLIFVAYIGNILIVSEPKYYGLIAIAAILCSPVIIGVGLAAFLRDKKNTWGRISFTLGICSILLTILIGLAFDYSS